METNEQLPPFMDSTETLFVWFILVVVFFLLLSN